MSEHEFHLTFLGTEARDMDWTRYGEPEIFGSTQTLLNGCVLIDAGRTGFRSLQRFDISPMTLEEIWFTHDHEDHCCPEEIAQLLRARGDAPAPLIVRASALLVEWLRQQLPPEFAQRVEWLPHHLGHPFESHGWKVTPVLANHLTNQAEDFPVHYLIQGKRRNLLYALDGAWMTMKTRNLLEGLHLDVIIWDATVERGGDYRIFGHNDFTMIQTMVKALTDAEIVDANTHLVLDHLARTLWRTPVRVPAPYLVATDGMTLDV